MTTKTLFTVYFIAMLVSNNACSRDAPASWNSFIKSTDVVVKGQVIFAELTSIEIQTRSANSNTLSTASFPAIQLSIAVANTYKTQTTNFDVSDKITILLDFHPTSPITTGSLAYFFLQQEKGKWILSDNDISIWKLESAATVDSDNQLTNFHDRPNILTFPYIYLQDSPSQLTEELSLYTDYNKKPKLVQRFTEPALLQYLHSPPCDIKQEQNINIEKMIHSSLKSKVNKNYRIVAKVKFAPFKMVDDLCIYRGGTMYTDPKEGYTEKVLIDAAYNPQNNTIDKIDFY